MGQLICVIAALALNTEGGLSRARVGSDPDQLLNYSFAVWVGSGVTGWRVQTRDLLFCVPFS